MRVELLFRIPLAVSIAGSRAIVRIEGDVDLLAAAHLVEALDVLLAEDIDRIDLHLGNVARVDSRAVEALASTHERLAARCGRVVVLGASDRVEDQFRRRGLSGLLRSDGADTSPALTARADASTS